MCLRHDNLGVANIRFLSYSIVMIPKVMLEVVLVLGRGERCLCGVVTAVQSFEVPSGHSRSVVPSPRITPDDSASDTRTRVYA